MEARPFIESERLALYRPTREDNQLFYDIYGSAEMMSDLGGPMSRMQSRIAVAENLRKWQRDGIGMGVVCLRSEDITVGICGIFKHEVDAEHVNEIGWMILPEFQGSGFATEASAAVIEWGTKTLQLESVHSFTERSSAASSRIVEKLGFEFVRETNYPLANGTMDANCWIKRANVAR